MQFWAKFFLGIKGKKNTSNSPKNTSKSPSLAQKRHFLGLFNKFAKIATFYVANRHRKSGATGPLKTPLWQKIATTGNPESKAFFILFKLILNFFPDGTHFVMKSSPANFDQAHPPVHLAHVEHQACPGRLGLFLGGQGPVPDGDGEHGGCPEASLHRRRRQGRGQHNFEGRVYLSGDSKN